VISAELERALARALGAAWRALNDAHFQSAMKPPALALSDAGGRLGQWRGGERTLELSRAFVLSGGWGRVVEVLKHEMAHQYVDEVLGNPDGAPHGPTYRAVCERIGIDARASGVPDAALDPPNAEEARVLGRVARLLALAGSDNRHEAELAMAEAQRLMLKHNLAAPPSRYAFRHLGEPTGRVQEHERILAGILGDHFFVEPIWVPVWRPLEGKRGSVLEVCGTRVNLDLAEHAHAFLLHTAERLWRDDRRARRDGSDRDRRTYLSGVMLGFGEKLEGERERQRAEGLVWVGDGDLRRFLRVRHPWVRSVRHGGPARNPAHARGKAAGRNVVLHKPVSASSFQGGGRMLPPRRD
jgi:hypothetical protein